jgi:hypothetical protein
MCIHSVEPVVLDELDHRTHECGTLAGIRDEAEMTTLAVGPSTHRKDDFEVPIIRVLGTVSGLGRG